MASCQLFQWLHTIAYLQNLNRYHPNERCQLPPMETLQHWSALHKSFFLNTKFTKKSIFCSRALPSSLHQKKCSPMRARLASFRFSSLHNVHSFQQMSSPLSPLPPLILDDQQACSSNAPATAIEAPPEFLVSWLLTHYTLFTVWIHVRRAVKMKNPSLPYSHFLAVLTDKGARGMKRRILQSYLVVSTVR